MNLITRLKRKAIDFGFFKIGKGKLCIATYHGVDTVGENKFNSRFIAKSSLESHLKFYKKHFNSVSLNDIENNNFNKEKINIHLTFDDGYLNNYKYAVPLLEEYKVHSTIYITAINKTENKILWPDLLDIGTFYLGDTLRIEGLTYTKTNGKFRDLYKQIKSDTRGGFEFKSKVENAVLSGLCEDFRSKPKLEDYWKLMNDEQISEVSKGKYVGIGSHGYYHNNLGVLSLQDAGNEIKDSKQYIESVIQKEVSSIAFPDGSYNYALLKQTQEAGFKTQFLFGAVDNEFLKINGVYDREGIYANTSSENEIFYKLINGKTVRRV